MLELRPGEIHLWQAFHERDPHPALREEYGALLSAEERAREARFRFEPDRFRFRVARALMRRLLGGYLGIEPASCLFTDNGHGRPSLANPQAQDAPLSFNLSHTRDLIVFAVTRGREIGVDVERMRDNLHTLELAANYFADFESQRVANAAGSERDDLFHQLWTLKESYIKARGLGLAIPLGKFGFRLSAQGPELWTDPELGDDAGRWTFIQRQPSEAHRLAICVERSDGRAPELVVRDFAGHMLASSGAPA